MRRLAIFWLACAMVGFLAAIGAAFALSYVLDGPDQWRSTSPQVRVAQRRGAGAASNAAVASPVLAPALGNR